MGRVVIEVTVKKFLDLTQGFNFKDTACTLRVVFIVRYQWNCITININKN